MGNNITNHQLVPKHIVLSDTQKESFYKESNLSSKQLPKILKSEPIIDILKAKVGDVIKIERYSPTAGTAYYYRVVIDG